jgi:hypothetical protein
MLTSCHGRILRALRLFVLVLAFVNLLETSLTNGNQPIHLESF